MSLPVIHDALYNLECRDGTLVDTSGKVFDVEAYSQFKYGESLIPRKYGYDLARYFVKNHPDIALSTERILLSPTSYKYLPTPAMAIAHAFMQALNCVRIEQRREPAMMTHIVRSQVGTDSYAMVTKAERDAMLTSLSQHVDAELVRGAVVILIDDVKVTGATQQRLHERLVELDPAGLCYLHVAVINPKYAADNAAIEAAMNSAGLPSLDTIAATIRNGHFQLNSRVCDFIVKWPHEAELAKFLSERSDEFLLELYEGISCSSVDMFSRYPSGTSALQHEICERQLPIAEFFSNQGGENETQ